MGQDIIIKDISKNNIFKTERYLKNFKKLISKIKYMMTNLLEKEFFKDKKFRKIKKKLIYEIAFARINEISELNNI